MNEFHGKPEVAEIKPLKEAEFRNIKPETGITLQEAKSHWDTEFADKEKGEEKPVRRIATINENLENTVHPTTNVPFVRKVIEYIGERIEGVFPEFQSKAEIQLPDNMLQSTDKEQFTYCVKQLAKQIENKPELATQFTPRQLEQIKNGEPKIGGLTWHHNEEPGKMQLVDTNVHAATGHTGGRNIWGGGTDCR